MIRTFATALKNRFFYLVLASLLTASCAQIITPTGGPKDETPPSPIRISPPALSTHSADGKFTITFDEFVTLQGANEQMLISPPLDGLPEFKQVRKDLQVKLPGPLRPNTTYTVNFGEAIRDLNEGNILQNFSYVFSTGPFVDSMSISGILLNAEDSRPVEGAWAMLYLDNVDSLPRTQKPDYVAKTGKDGRFMIPFIPEGNYKIFALKDENANYRYDVQKEMVGFLDSTIASVYSRVRVPDSTQATDSLLAPVADTMPTQKLGKGGSPIAPVAKNDLFLRMFTAIDTAQFLKKAYCEHYGKVNFVYNLPLRTARVEALGLEFKKTWNIDSYGKNRDTLTVWSTALPDDSVRFVVHWDDGKSDTALVEMKARSDKIEVSASGGGKGVRAKAQKEFKLEGQFLQMIPKPGEPSLLRFNHPITDIDLSGIELTQDSLPIPFDVALVDTGLLTWQLWAQWKPGSTYRATVLPGTFTDLYALSNDTIRADFKIRLADELGRVIVKATATQSSAMVLELRDRGGNLIQTRKFNQSTVLDVAGLEPGAYTMRAIVDRNQNGRWDTGNYLRKMQPERIIPFEKGIEVRANWDLDLEWEID